MRKFAEIDENNVVIRVLVANDEAWLTENLDGVWLESFDDGTRVRRAGAGFTYDADRDAFIPPTPYPSWVLDEDTCLWVAPIAYPAEGAHTWDEAAGDWVEVTDENS